MQSDGMATLYSIKHEWDGAVALITGGSGYIGSVVLEQLLRTTNVSKIYLLLRPRKGQPIDSRLQALLQGPLFHHVRENVAITSKVCAVGGDISQAGLGLAVEDRAMLLSSLDFIIHCAADIRLEADIQETLTANFEGTRTVLGLAAAAGDHLKALVHVSSAFVNMNQPCSSTIDEQLYPLRYGKQVADVELLAQELLSLPKADANSRAAALIKRWNFPNTYTLGKHMSEQLVARYQAKQQLPVAIVRPSLVSAIAGEPYPGYVGNWAGPIGATAAMAIGLFDCLEPGSVQLMQHLIDSMHGHHGGDDCSEDSLPSDMLLGGSEGSSETQHKQPALLIVHAATSSTYPVTLMECWNAGLEFLDTHEPPFRITTAPIPKMPADFKPSDDDVLACRRRIGWKVWALCKLLKLFGQEKEAKKLQVGFETFCVHNNSKTDKDLVFSTHALVALEATLNPAEAAEYLLVWQPVTNRCQTSSNGSGSKGVPAGAAGALQCQHGKLASIVEAAADESSLPSFDTCSECGASAAVPADPTSAAAPTAGRGELALAPISGNIVWRRYFHTQMASVFRTLYGVKVVRRKMMASAVERVCEQGAQLTDADYIEHDFVAIR
eukprot:gene12149-12287_t